MDAIKAIPNFGSNASKLADGAKKVGNLPEHAKKELLVFLELIKKMPEMVINANDIGKKANKDNKETLKDIFETYHPDPKLGEKEFREREAAKKKAARKAKAERAKYKKAAANKK